MSSLQAVSRALACTESTRSQEDLAALVETYAPVLYRVAFSVLRNAAEAEDAVQDAFVRVLEHQAALPAVRDIRVWLMRIAWNLALDRRRRARPEPLEPALLDRLADPHASPEQALDDARRASATIDALNRLPKVEQQALLLSAVEELTTEEVARVLGRTESATRALIFRARQRLRERLGRKGV